MSLRSDAIDEFISRCMARERAMLALDGYQVDFVPGGGALVVTFEPALTGKAAPNPSRPAWGQAFLQRRGHSMLGVKRQANDWYRGVELHRLFRALQAAAFFGRFERTLFYGPSMGGYAALALAAAAPGCTVLALNPQSTLAPDRVWFDQRFAGRRAEGWQGDFVDGADGARQAAKVYVCYDPHQPKDRLHAQRLPAHNRVDLRLPHVGHTTAQALNLLGLLGTVFDRALDGTLDEPQFRQMARERLRLADYHYRLAERALWRPRRLRHLFRALELDPGHEPAILLTRQLTGPVPDPALPPPRRRWPLGMVLAPRVPLLYLNVPKSASTTIQNHLLYIATGSYPAEPASIHQHPGLRRSREDSDETHRMIGDSLAQGALVFTFVRDPGRRAYACFNEKIMHKGRHSFLAIRHTLERHWGLLPPQPDQPPTLEQQRENFGAFLAFVEANIAGDTEIRRDPHWCPQGPMMVQYRQHLKINFVGKVENFAADMAMVLHMAGVRRIPDLQQRPWRHPPAPFEFDEVTCPDIQARLDRIYESDYQHLGYRRQEA